LYCVIKIGGSTLADLQKTFFTSIKAKRLRGEKIVIVHGAGPEINKQLQIANIPVKVIDGIRVTDQETLSIVKDSLERTANPFLVERLREEGIPATGVTGDMNRLIICDYLDHDQYGFVGAVKKVETTILKQMTDAGEIPVLPSIGITCEGQAVNINADIAAGEIAAALSAGSVSFVTDTPGIKINGNIVKTAVPDQLKEWIKNGDIHGGMIPKVKAVTDCLDRGIHEVKISDQTMTGTTCFKEAIV
jgi:acetylglutamate kinase